MSEADHDIVGCNVCRFVPQETNRSVQHCTFLVNHTMRKGCTQNAVFYQQQQEESHKAINGQAILCVHRNHCLVCTAFVTRELELARLKPPPPLKDINAALRSGESDERNMC